MPEGMAQVQPGTDAGFAFVLRNDRRLDLAGTLNRIGKGRRISSQQPVEMLFQPGEEGRVVDESVLDHFCQPGEELALRQRAERSGICQYHEGLIERPDHVFPFRMVDRCLAAHR